MDILTGNFDKATSNAVIQLRLSEKIVFLCASGLYTLPRPREGLRLQKMFKKTTIIIFILYVSLYMCIKNLIICEYCFVYIFLFIANI
jgi:hypothetical protein